MRAKQHAFLNNMANDPAISAPTRFIARQPILNTQRVVIGYELLFRSGWENHFPGDADGDATSKTIDNCTTMGIDSLVGPGLAFVNCTRDVLVKQLVSVLPAKRVVLEILETVEPDEELLDACRTLRRMGYTFALDDFLPRPEMEPLIEIASYVKIDFRLADSAKRREIYEVLKGSPATLIAEKIEDQNDFSDALAEGYTHFQGYFFCRPVILANREIPPNLANYMRILTELSNAHLNMQKVASLVEAESSLCYRLLRLANSAAVGVRGEITSVRGAMLLVGEDRFRALVSVAVSNALGSRHTPALTSLSLERARFCELIAPLIGEDPSEQYLLGLLSTLDAILQRPMEVLMKSLPLRAEAKDVLLGAASRVALPLNLARTLESGAWERCLKAAEEFGVCEQTLADIYIKALREGDNLLVRNG